MPQQLTEAQRRAVEHQGPALHIVACAGSGKTEVLSRRCVRLLKNGTDPASIIAFTFTRKAAAELKSRIELRAADLDESFRSLPPVARGMFIGTTHAWALQTLQEAGGIYEAMDGLTEEAEWALLQRFARRLGIVQLFADRQDSAAETVATAPAIEAFLRSAEVVHNQALDRRTLRKRAPEFAMVLKRYEWLQQRMRVLPFRAMISHALYELKPGGRLRLALGGRIRHVLVDEFQDFNRAQDRLLARLVDLGATVTVVGDDDQAIYQWRGGDVSLFVDFAHRYAGAESIQLGANHRCRPAVVDLADEVVRHLPVEDRLAKTFTAARQAAENGAVEVYIADTPEREAEAIATRIATLLERGHQPGDVAVLFRSVRTSAQPLVRALAARQIPIEMGGRSSLLSHPEMALLARIFVYWAGGDWRPNSRFTLERVTREELLDGLAAIQDCPVEDASALMDEIDTLGRRVREQGVRDSVALFDELIQRLGLLRGDGDRARELGLGRFSEMLTEFDRSIRRAAPAEFYTEPAPDTVEELREDETLRIGEDEASEDTAATPTITVLGMTRGEIYLMRLRAFLEHFAGRAAEEGAPPAPGSPGAVQIMTVHQAKGLEFPVVFLPSLVEGRFPSSAMGREALWYLPDDLFDRERYEGREQDEARLLYVALTRAQELLFVSWYLGQNGRTRKPSRFIEEYLRKTLLRARQYGQASPARRHSDVSAELLALDFSSLVTYLECGYRYWLRHACGFQPLLARELGFGRVLHHTIAELARASRKRGRAPDAQDADAALDEAFYLPFAGPVADDRLKGAAQRRIRKYVRSHGSELTRTIRPEMPFEIPFEGARLKGRIDLMLRVNGDDREVELVDFKTSENRPPSRLHENQLRLYGEAARRMGFEPLRLSIHDLDGDGRRLDVGFDRAARRTFENELAGWIGGIRAERFDPTGEAETCHVCDFASMCPHSRA